jgi:AcrR family transcriptional regulator
VIQPRLKQHERRAETRRRLIEGAIACLLEVGYGGATVLEICRRAEMTTGALQHNFGSKQGLMEAVVTELFRSIADRVPPTNPSQATLAERIDRLVQHYWGIYGDERYFAVLDILLATRHDADLTKRVAKHRDETLVSTRDFLLVEFADVGLPEEELLDIAKAMMDHLRGYAIRRMFERDQRSDEAALALARDMVRARLDGALKRSTENEP